MMNVLMVGPNKNAQGGISTVVNNYLNSRLSDEVKFKYIDTINEGNKIYKLAYGSIAFIRILIYLVLNSVDLVHIHMSSRKSFYRKSIIVYLARIFKKKIIIHLHGSEFDIFYKNESNTKQRKYITKIFNKADLFIALSEEWKQKIKQYCDTNIAILHNSVYIPNTNLYNNSSNNILLLGKLDVRKGVYDLIDIIDGVVSKHPEIRFVFAGDGDIKKLKTKIQEKGIAKYVDVLGWINNEQKITILRDTLIYTLPSYNEGMPMSILEAMSYGIPVVASNVGGIPQIIDHNSNGYLIKPGDNDSLKRIILKLIQEEDHRKDISKKAYNKICTEFSIESHILDLVGIYKCLCKL